MENKGLHRDFDISLTSGFMGMDVEEDDKDFFYSFTTPELTNIIEKLTKVSTIIIDELEKRGCNNGK